MVFRREKGYSYIEGTSTALNAESNRGFSSYPQESAPNYE